MPALAGAKRKAQRINSVSNLKQIGLAARIFAGDNNDRLPFSFDEMKNELGSDKITYDTETGQRYTYLGGGMSMDALKPESVLAYSQIVNDHCEVLFADGSVEQITDGRFAELSQRGLMQLATPQDIAEQQREAISMGQLGDRPGASTMTATPQAATAGGVVGTINGAGNLFGVTTSGGSTVLPHTPTAAGIRSIRIDLPQTGQPFLFTKVLNIRDEPLSIHARIMPLRTFQTIQQAWQTAAFLIGLVVWWMQWRHANRSSFILAVALALIIGSVCAACSFNGALCTTRSLSWLPQIVTLAIVAFLIWKYWPRDSKTGNIRRIANARTARTDRQHSARGRRESLLYCSH